MPEPMIPEPMMPTALIVMGPYVTQRSPMPLKLDDHRRVMGPLAARRLDAELAHLPPEGGGVVVCVASLCAHEDLDAAVAALRQRVPEGGVLRFVEHVGRSGMLTRVGDALWSRAPMGCHVGHDVPAALRRGGFTVTDLERFTVPSAVPMLRRWVSGVAR
jgi:hypothetical protein